jgi:hypothetical protein
VLVDQQLLSKNRNTNESKNQSSGNERSEIKLQPLDPSRSRGRGGPTAKELAAYQNRTGATNPSSSDTRRSSILPLKSTADLAQPVNPKTLLPLRQIRNDGQPTKNVTGQNDDQNKTTQIPRNVESNRPRGGQ